MCSIAENFYLFFVFSLALGARHNTAQLVKIPIQKHLIRYIYSTFKIHALHLMTFLVDYDKCTILSAELIYDNLRYAEEQILHINLLVVLGGISPHTRWSFDLFHFYYSGYIVINLLSCASCKSIKPNNRCFSSLVYCQIFF